MLFITLLYLLSKIFLGFSPPAWVSFTYGILGIISAMVVTAFYLRREQKKFSDIGLTWKNDTIFNFLKGLLLGTGIFALIVLVLINFTGLHIGSNPKGINLATALGFIAILPLALMEELAFRSYTFVSLNKKYGLWITQLVVAIAYAGYHIATGWSVTSAFAGPFVWAFIFGLAAAKTGGIAMPLGIHIALNMLQPLTGLKGEEYSLWSVTYPEGSSASLINHTDTVGLYIQGIILIFGLLLTAFYAGRVKAMEQSFSV
jgi:membrane protease YdiL (CAAX protease family)